MKKAEWFGKISARTVLCAAIVFAIGVGPASACEGNKKCAVKGTCAATKAAELKPQTTCPVMGNPINKELFVDANGKRVYVCCPACIDPIKKNPQKYIKKLEKMGQSVETIGGAAVDKKDTSLSVLKCPMMNDTSKVKGCYTCPMHPEVMKKEAGKCPTCGMDLVFKTCPVDTAKAKGRGGCCKMKK